jgi:putative hydrolase
VVEVAKAAADYGTYIELNAKKVHLTDEEIYNLLKTDVNFLISSDAHSPNRVGEISLVEKMIERTNFPQSRIHNINGKLPKMRFAQFKGE